MKSSLRKLRGFALHKHEHRDRREHHPPAHQDELLQAAQDMLDMRNCYDSLLSAAAATANSAYEFSEALRELGTCLLEKTALNDDEDIGRVLLMLGKAQFELQKLVDSYRAHIIQTISTPSESLLKELQTVEEMKRQCDDKRDLYKFMLAAQRDKGKSRHAKGENFSLQQLKAAQEDYQEEATLFAFRLKSLKQGQSRSLLTQASRHHAAQLNFFRKGVKSLEVVEPHVKLVSEQQHIDYQFSGLEDDGTDEYDDDEEEFDYNDDGELSFDYGQRDQSQDVGSISRNSMELEQAAQMSASTSNNEIAKENLDRTQADFLFFNRDCKAVSMSAPLLNDKKSELSERITQVQPLSVRKFHTYVLPTPSDVKSSSLTDSVNSISASRVEFKGSWPAQLFHSSPLQPNMLEKDFRDVELLSPTRLPEMNSVLKESNSSSGPIRNPPSFFETLSLSQLTPSNVSDYKKIKIQAFSGPLTSKAPSSKQDLLATGSMTSVEYPPVVSVKPRHASTPQLSMSHKVSPSASPPISSPRINELHELPRPPIGLTKPTRLASLFGHSAPLVSRGSELYATSKQKANSSYTASPLPTPPGVMARSFSIPSSGLRTADVTVVRFLEVPNSQRTTADIASPPLTPIPLANSLPASTATDLVTQVTKTKGFL